MPAVEVALTLAQVCAGIYSMRTFWREGFEDDDDYDDHEDIQLEVPAVTPRVAPARPPQDPVMVARTDAGAVPLTDPAHDKDDLIRLFTTQLTAARAEIERLKRPPSTPFDSWRAVKSAQLKAQWDAFPRRKRSRKRW